MEECGLTEQPQALAGVQGLVPHPDTAPTLLQHLDMGKTETPHSILTDSNEGFCLPLSFWAHEKAPTWHNQICTQIGEHSCGSILMVVVVLLRFCGYGR